MNVLSPSSSNFTVDLLPSIIASKPHATLLGNCWLKCLFIFISLGHNAHWPFIAAESRMEVINLVQSEGKFGQQMQIYRQRQKGIFCAMVCLSRAPEQGKDRGENG